MVESHREGRRYVLRDTARSRYFELAGGDRDAFVWERLDGTKTLRQIGLEFVDATGAIPRDLSKLVDGLSAEGFIEGAPEAPSPSRKALALGLALPIPGFGVVLQLLARIPSLVARPLPFALVGALGAASLLLAPRVLGPLQGRLLELQGSVLRGVLLLLALNASVSLLEAVARAAALLRGGGRVGPSGIALQAGLPGFFVDTRDEVVLAVEHRVVVRLAPLAVSLGTGGLGLILLLYARTHTPPEAGRALGALWDHLTPFFPSLASDAWPVAVYVVLGKVAWTGLLRALFHANPLGPSGAHDAIEAWLHLEDLNAAARRFLTHDLLHHLHPHEGETSALSRREHALLGYAALAVAWLALAARTLVHVAIAEVASPLDTALRAAERAAGVGATATDRSAALAILVPILVVAVPLAFVAWELVRSLAHAFSRSAARSRLARSPRGAGVVLASLAVLAAATATTQPPLNVATMAVGLGLLAVLTGFRAQGTDGHGRATLALSAASVAIVLETFAQLLLADMGAQGRSLESLERAVAYFHFFAACVLLGAALCELGTAASRRALFLAIGVGVALAVPAPLLVPIARAHALPGAPPALAAPLAALGAALAYAASVKTSLGSLRSASRFWLTLSALSLAASYWVPIGQPASIFEKLGPEDAARAEGALAVLGLGLALAAFFARGREESARVYAAAVALPTGKTNRAPGQVLLAVLGPLREKIAEHMGTGAAEHVTKAMHAIGTAENPSGLAALALRATKAVAGTRWFSRYLEANLARIPSTERMRVSPPLATIPELAELARHVDEAAQPGPAARAKIFGAVPILGPLPDDDIRELSLLAFREPVAAGTAIVREGEEGDRFYVIARGEADVSVHGKNGVERAVAHLHAGDAFGEAALLRHERRAATVTARADCDLLVVERSAFLDFIQARKELLARILDRLEDVWLVRSIGIFSELDGAQVAQIFQSFYDVKAEQGAKIIQQGEVGDTFYVIREGEVSVDVEDGYAQREVAVLGRGDYFGEMALLHDAPRAASVTARTPVELLALGRADFLRLVSGRSRARLEAESELRERADGHVPGPEERA